VSIPTSRGKTGLIPVARHFNETVFVKAAAAAPAAAPAAATTTTTTTLKRRILKEEIESICRLRKQYEETIGHLTPGCPILAKNEYVIRHYRICTHLHYSICKTLGTETTENWFSHIPKPVCQHEDITVLLNQGGYKLIGRFWQIGPT
jgi:hypothetical protein